MTFQESLDPRGRVGLKLPFTMPPEPQCIQAKIPKESG